MSLLLYCAAKAAAPLNSSRSGVAEMPLCRLDCCDLSMFFSRSPSPEVWLRAPLRRSALQFHRVLLNLFESAAVVPFRFPTILESDAALIEHVNAHATEYNALLEKFADKAQMEIRVRFAAGNAVESRSGAEFLRERQKRRKALDNFGCELGTATRDIMGDWRHKSLTNGFRGFALVERTRVAKFKERIQTIPVPGGLEARVHGPWPVTEFLDLSGENQA